MGGWRKLQSGFIFTNTVGVVKSRRISCTRHVAYLEEMRNMCRMFVRTRQGKRPGGMIWV
jgi:hypothetical protein